MTDRAKKKKDTLIVVLIPLMLFGLAVFSWIKPADAYSDSERRSLEQVPELSKESFVDGSFMTDFEKYSVDQFPMREAFRQLKSKAALYGFRQKDIHGIYVQDGYLSKMEYPLDEESLGGASDKFFEIYQKYLSGTNVKTYFSIIPDKNYYLAQQGNVLSMEYQQLYDYMRMHNEYMKYIDITGLLNQQDYYKTDTHWRQECILDVADALAKEMGVELDREYSAAKLEKPFYGVYAGQSGLGTDGEVLVYLEHADFEECKVYDYENKKEITIYDMEKANGKDPYEMFLSGPLSLITIENPNAATDKELILFRDSFGSSLAPLLVNGYSKITLVDIRYLSSAYLDQWITFDDQDVLFLYSTLVLNHSETLR